MENEMNRVDRRIRDTWLGKWVMYKLTENESCPEIQGTRSMAYDLLERNGIAIPDQADRAVLHFLLWEDYMCRVKERMTNSLPFSLELEMTDLLRVAGWGGVCKWLRAYFPEHLPIPEQIAGEMETELRRNRIRVMRIVTKEELSVRIDECNLMIRTYNCLKRANIHTVEDVMEHSKAEILEIRNFSWKCLKDLEEKLSEFILQKLVRGV